MRHSIWLSTSILLVSCTGSDSKVGLYDTPPSVSIVSPTEGSTFNEGEVVTFEFIVNDDIDDPVDLTLVFASDFQGDLEAIVTPDSTGAGSYSTANLDVGNHVITVTAVDSYGQSASDFVDIVIEDVPDAPEISVVHPTGGEFGQENSVFEFVAEVFDARDDSEDLAVVFASDLDGEFCTPEPDAEGFARCEAELSPGEHTLTYTATNSLAFNGSATVYFVVQPTEDIDDDGDGFTENQGDCNDEDPSINPIADEVENGVDDDCNGEIDDGDFDGDGYTTGQGDCDNNDPNVHPNAQELPNNTDDDCDGIVDEGTVNYDDDGDGQSENQGDCDDSDNAVYLGALEICGNGKDDNCNGDQNEINGMSCTNFYRDFDGDGYGDVNAVACSCSGGLPDAYYTATSGDDCYDQNVLVTPNQTGYFSSDRGDGSFDYNCDGQQEKELDNGGGCAGINLSLNDACILSVAGWNGAAPACGSNGSYLVDNDSCVGSGYIFGIPTSCTTAPTTVQQSCR
ncbi:MAG: MopE-related protein [Myxococcota bacterium]|nr:MopE-related protein [Myxococcota bacterium]